MLIYSHTGAVMANKVIIAQRFWPKLRGLQFRKNIPWDFAYVLINCNSIHTCFMRFDLDAVFVDSDWKVLRVYRGLKPFRATRAVKNAYAVIELTAGDRQIEVGHRLELIE